MQTSIFRTSILILIALVCCVSATSQTGANVKAAPCTIKGRVTLKGQPVAGVSIGARLVKNGAGRTFSYRGQSDQDGNYVISDVPDGSYQVSPEAPEFWVAEGSRERVLILSAGETVESVDFILSRGGVITGKVTSTRNRPMIAHVVELSPLYVAIMTTTVTPALTFETDDRGIYRAFGLPAGKYRLSVSRIGGGIRSSYQSTFFPGTIDASKAELVEVTDGSEIKNVDITVTVSDDMSERFSVTGKVIDDKAGQPAPEIRLELIRLDGNVRYGISTIFSDTNGQFKFAEVEPGKYAIAGYGVNNPLRVERTEFAITDQDVSGLQLKTVRKGTVSGIVVLESGQSKLTLTQLGPIFLNAFVTKEKAGAFGEPARVNSDGRFQMNALPSGLARFSVGAIEAGGLPKGLEVARVERDAVVQDRGLEIVEGESITGVRVVLKYSNGVIRGVVKLATGVLSATARVQVTVRSSQREPSSQAISATVDARGSFLVEGLAGGPYEVRAFVSTPGMHTRFVESKQTVTVSENSVSEVVLIVEGPANP